MNNNLFSLDIFNEILKLNIGVSQSDNKTMFNLLNKIYPLNFRSFPSNQEFNGWIVPQEWIVKKALIKKNDEVVFNGKLHPLSVAGYSISFYGTLSKKQLDKHIFFRKELPESIPFHCMNNYRPWAKDWGFCIPYNNYKNWSDGDYLVKLDTEFRDGKMDVAECFHKGRTKDTIVFNAHTCHLTQFNDGFSGVAIILELFKWLSKKQTKYSYLAVLGPEHLGTVFYLNCLTESAIKKLKAGIFIEMVGLNEPIALQKSFTGTSIIDKVAKHAIESIVQNFKIGDFRTIVGNDETVWESPGIEVPFISIARKKARDFYKEYHTNKDDMSINHINKLKEIFEVLKQIINILEKDCIVSRKFTGLVALSNPKYDLYIQRPDPTVKKNLSSLDISLGNIQDVLPRYFNGKLSILEISLILDISFDFLFSYLQKFKDKDLIELTPVKTLDFYFASDLPFY